MFSVKPDFGQKIISGMLSVLAILPLGTTLVSAEKNQWDFTAYLSDEGDIDKGFNMYSMVNYFTVYNPVYRELWSKIEILYADYDGILTRSDDVSNLTPDDKLRFINNAREISPYLREALRRLKIDYTKNTVNLIDRVQFLMSRIENIVFQISNDPEFSGMIDKNYVSRLSYFLSDLFVKNIYFEVSPCASFYLPQPVTLDVGLKLSDTLHSYIDDSIRFNNSSLTDCLRELESYIIASMNLEDYNDLVRKTEIMMHIPMISLKY